MATKVFLANPETPVESVFEGVGAAVQSSYTVGVTIDLATTKINADGTTRAVLKSEVVESLYNIIQSIEKDAQGDWG